MNRWSLLFAVSLPFASLADGHHKPEPPTTPVQAPPGCSCWWQPVLVIGGAAALIAIPIYNSRDSKGNEKKVEAVPTSDGKGAMLSLRVTVP
jgi:hypothetical protein